MMGVIIETLTFLLASMRAALMSRRWLPRRPVIESWTFERVEYRLICTSMSAREARRSAVLLSTSRAFVLSWSANLSSLARRQMSRKSGRRRGSPPDSVRKSTPASWSSSSTRSHCPVVSSRFLRSTW